MWAQPWAWLGLAGLAVPIAIHLLARHQAVHAVFPTLRFIDASELNAIRRQRLTDIPLLLLRLLIVALAVAAIAGPRWGDAAMASGSEVARATIVDTSASAAGSAATESAAATTATADDRQVQLSVADLGAGLDAAVAWARERSGAREIVVRSDFQRGSLTASDVERVPDGIGLRFDRVPSHPAAMPVGFSRDGDIARMVWPVTEVPASGAITVLAGPDQDVADRMLAATLSVTGPIKPNTSSSPVTVVLPKATERASMANAVRPIDSPWMFAVAEKLLADRSGRVRVGVGPRGLTVLSDADAGSLEAAEVVAAIAQALNQVTPVEESDPRLIADAELDGWRRPAESSDVRLAGEPQGRWLWMAVVGLLLVETFVRRRAV